MVSSVRPCDEAQLRCSGQQCLEVLESMFMLLQVTFGCCAVVRRYLVSGTGTHQTRSARGRKYRWSTRAPARTCNPSHNPTNQPSQHTTITIRSINEVVNEAANPTLKTKQSTIATTTPEKTKQAQPKQTCTNHGPKAHEKPRAPSRDRRPTGTPPRDRRPFWGPKATHGPKARGGKHSVGHIECQISSSF